MLPSSGWRAFYSKLPVPSFCVSCFCGISPDSPERDERLWDIWYQVLGTKVPCHWHCSQKICLCSWTEISCLCLSDDTSQRTCVTFSLQSTSVIFRHHFPHLPFTIQVIFWQDSGLRTPSHRRKYPSSYQLVQKLKPRHLSQKHFSEEKFYCNLHKMWGQPSLKQPLERKS